VPSARSVQDSAMPTSATPPARLQDLPPAQAHLCLHVEQFLTGLLPPDALRGHGVLVACSGGCDSTALLIILACLRQRLGITLAVAHLDHQLRPEAADEAAAVQALAVSLGLPCSVGSADINALSTASGTGLEETARRERYAFLERARVQHHCRFIATGHHLNDLAEDVLMRLLRGTGWPSLGGMEAVCLNRHLIRPLLVTERNKLEGFLAELGIGWCEDASNAHSTYLRNRIRAEFLPLFLRENPSFLGSVASLWQQARTDAEHWTAEEDNILSSLGESGSLKDSLTNLSYQEPAAPDSEAPAMPPLSAVATERTLTRDTLTACSKALRLRLYKRCLDSLGEGQALAEGLERLDAAWKRNEGGRTVQFPGGKRATITSGNIVFHGA